VRCQLLSKSAQVDQLRSDGGSHEASLQWSSSSIASSDVPMQIATSSAKASNKTRLSQVPLKKTSPLPRTSYFLSVVVGQSSSSEGLDATAARQVATEDLSAAKTKTPNVRNAPKKKSATLTMAPPIPTLIAPPGNGRGITPPPHGGGHPRPITNGLWFGNRGKLLTKNGTRDVRKCNQKGAQNRHR
jgi:hypothetical protein